jgi:tRNA(fMet)-specific endonuclease VapC
VTLLLVDTTFLIDVEREDTALDNSIDDDDDVAVAAISIAELQVGVELAKANQRDRRQAFVDEIVDVLPILPYDLGVARSHAGLLAAVRRAGRPRGARDLIIAATAKATNRTVVTADPAGFADLPGVEVRHHR